MMVEHKKKQRVPVGIDDFGRLIADNYYFVDKSLMIKEVIDAGATVTLLPRPRRFGKTLNLSMLRYFFEKTEESNKALFVNLEIEKYPDYMAHQGEYPVIWLTFKNVKKGTWAACYEKLCEIIGAEFRRHLSTIEPVLDATEKTRVEKIITGTASEVVYEGALYSLSLYLQRAYKTRVIILIDEYDTPIHEGYTKSYISEVMGFMRNFFGAGLKGNETLEIGVITGILRVSKESIFSGLNNLRVCSLVDERFSNKFGLLEHEVSALLTYFGLENSINSVRHWYNGYQSGFHKVYNPWSIINLVDNRGVIKPYWINTSDNALIQNLLKRASAATKEEFEVLIGGGKVTKAIQDNIIMANIGHEETLWNFLLFCGYLTFENYITTYPNLADLSIPNEEVRQSYITFFRNWFANEIDTSTYNTMLKSLILGDIASFKEFFERLTLETLSSFDVGNHEPERFYHALVLGMLASLSETHLIRSNRESGMGRHDVMLIPKDTRKLGIILEFKKVRKQQGESLKSAAQNALAQIEEKEYETELRALGIHKITKLGIAFEGKKSLVLSA